MSGVLYIVFFFFKQKTAYEMRISDWSSDVCSSDLSFVRDLFRKNGFRRDGVGGSDQARIISRILQGQDVVGLLPTGAGKSLPYMLAGLLLPGMTLYVGPLISLLQDQAERLREAGIGHVEYISSAQGQEARETALERVQSQGTRFLLVSPERFLTRSEEQTSELQSLMRISYAVFCLKKNKINTQKTQCKKPQHT